MSSREEVLRDALLPERLAPLLTGTTDEELTASAHEVAADLGIRPTATEAVLVARHAIAHAAKTRAFLRLPEDAGDQ